MMPLRGAEKSLSPSEARWIHGLLLYMYSIAQEPRLGNVVVLGSGQLLNLDLR